MRSSIGQYNTSYFLWQIFGPSALPHTVVISTSSVALQKAILKEYIPFLSDLMMEMGFLKHPIRAALRKGKERFVCDVRLSERRSALQISHRSKGRKDALYALERTMDLDEVIGLAGFDRRLVCVPDHCPADCKAQIYANSYLLIFPGESEPFFESAGAGLFSTMRDYLIFSRMLLNNGVYEGVRLLSEAAISFLRSNQLNSMQSPSFDWPEFEGYGYGNLMRILENRLQAGTLTEAGEFGWAGWAGTYFEVSPAQKTIILLMTGCLDRDLSRSHRIIKNIVYGNLCDRISSSFEGNT